MSKRRKVPRHILARLRSEGKLTTRSERTFQAEQSLRDLMATRGHIPPAAMRSAYRRGVSVQTLVEISGRTERQVKESIVKAGEKMDNETNGAPAPTAPTDSAESIPVEPPPSAQEAPEGATDEDAIGNLSDGKLTQRATSLRQAGNADAAAEFDHEAERRADAAETD